MKIYEVGGAVRDKLLGLPVKDRDYVVVGATPEEMIRRGYKPVGRDFPVFLHPETHEEYALARTEPELTRGYRGFEFHARPTLRSSRILRAATSPISAIARDERGGIIDPYGGSGDSGAGRPAPRRPAFTEDPVRILRVALRRALQPPSRPPPSR
ncbi:MAG: hypothetical protein KIT18_05720 [Burkholderiales bacterium]|nr:hypothetical protein [Burkholderiales bacterium]